MVVSFNSRFLRTRTRNNPKKRLWYFVFLLIVIFVVISLGVVRLWFPEHQGHLVKERDNLENYEEFTIMTYNVLFQHYPHGFLNILGLNKYDSDWESRRESVKNIVKRRQPDICCFQEARSDHPNWPFYSQNRDMRTLDANLVAFGPADDGTTGIYNPNFFTAIGKPTLGIDYIGQKFTTPKGTEIYIFNVHLHPKKRDELSEICGSYHSEFSHLHAIILGDFNQVQPQLCDDFSSVTETASEKTNSQLPTFIGQSVFDPDVEGCQFDHIYVSGGIQVLSSEIVDDRRSDNDLLPSDHRPIFARLRIQN